MLQAGRLKQAMRTHKIRSDAAREIRRAAKARDKARLRTAIEGALKARLSSLYITLHYIISYHIMSYYKAIGIIRLQGFAYNHKDNSYMAKLEKVKFEQMFQIK